MIRGKRSRGAIQRIYENGIKVPGRLEEHHHIIRVFATYIAKREAGLLLEPVADGGDLDHFLEHVEELQIVNSEDSRLRELRLVLQRAFGCLAGGLAFMHQRRVRHKDIKPQNILVHRGCFLYTDFGYSLDSSQFSNSTTEGQPDSLTRRYSAPEVLNNGERNSSSDVYSLGCIYLEILAVLLKQPSLASQEEPFAEHLDHIHEQLQAGDEKVDFNRVLVEMTAYDRFCRPKVVDVNSQLLSFPGHCCGACENMGGPVRTPISARVSTTAMASDPKIFLSTLKLLKAFVTGNHIWDEEQGGYLSCSGV